MFDEYKAITSVLDEMEVACYSRDGVEANLADWKDNKSGLIDLLRKHPNWVEEAHAIVLKDEMLPRPIDADQAMLYLNACIIYTNRHVKPGLHFPSIIFASTTVTDDMVDQVQGNAFNITPGFLDGIKVGMKTSRFLRSAFQRYGVNVDSKEFQEFFQPFADTIANVRKDAVNLILSVNPGDYLSSSYGTNWASCHIINPDVAVTREGSHHSGCYKAGTLSYMNDESTAVLYSVPELPDDLSELPTLRKATRQMYHIDVERREFVQSRLYPYGGTDWRHNAYLDVVKRVLAKCYAMPDSWDVVNDFPRTHFYTTGLHYKDYTDVSRNMIHTCTLHGANHCTSPVTIGNDAYCLECGDIIDNEAYIVCRQCGGGQYRCDGCGDYFDDEDDLYYCEDTDDYRCSDCSWYCEDCDNTYSNEMDYEYVNGVRVCEHCLYNSDYYVQCEECGEWMTTDDAWVTEDGYHLCHHCYQACTQTCSHCENVFYNTDLTDTADGLLCDECVEEMEPCACCGALYLNLEMASDGAMVCECCLDRYEDELKESEDAA